MAIDNNLDPKYSNGATPEVVADKVLFEQDPLKLGVEDAILVDVVDKRIEESKSWFAKEKNLYDRQKKNENYLFGRSLITEGKQDYESDFLDNAIYEAEASIKPIALSRLPDLIVTPGQDTPESRHSAEELSKVLDNDIKRRQHRKVLALAFKHMPVYFTGVIKVRWDPLKGEFGDYVFENVHPNNIVLDHTATTNNPDDMDFIAEALTLSIKEAIIRFPEAKEKLFTELKIPEEQQENETKLATKIKIWEVWFKWYEKSEDQMGNVMFKPIECVLWKYKKLLLKKMKNPNWDWEGVEQPTIDGQPAEESQLREVLLYQLQGMNTQINIGTETLYKNYFKQPRKPYIFLGYDQWGEMPYDETSRIEQVIPLQKDVHKRGQQITEMADNAHGKDVFSKDSGVEAEQIQGMDFRNPKQALLIPGDLSKMYVRIEPDQPSAALFQDKELNKSAIFEKMGAHDTTRGEVTTDTATTSQIAREQDFGRIDDMTEETINAAAEEMAQWTMQMIKLRYSEEHFVKLLGRDGSVTFTRVHSDMIEDGMEVTVSASGVDKMMRKRQAVEMARMSLIDPLTFYEDLEVSNPKERAERLLIFNSDPMTYVTKYIMDLETTEQQVNALNQDTAVMDQQMMAGQVPPMEAPVEQQAVVEQAPPLVA